MNWPTVNLDTSDQVAIAAAAVSLLAAVVAGFIAARSARSLAEARSAEERRAFCLHLQQQFDSPEMFRCRFKAWQQLRRGEFSGQVKLSELLNGESWTPELSLTLHFFESLDRYCAEALIDQSLAIKLFGRSYLMWWNGLLSRIEIDETGAQYTSWLAGVTAFQKRLSDITTTR